MQKNSGSNGALIAWECSHTRRCKWEIFYYWYGCWIYVMQEIVLCKVYRKATSLKVLEQRAAIEEIVRAPNVTSLSPPMQGNFSFYDHQKSFNKFLLEQNNVVHKVEGVTVIEEEEDNKIGYPSQIMGVGPIKEHYSELLSPKLVLDWTMDSLWPN